MCLATSFEIDDSAITENGFSSDPSELTDNTLTLTDVNPLYVKTYSQGDSRFAVALVNALAWTGYILLITLLIDFQ